MPRSRRWRLRHVPIHRNTKEANMAQEKEAIHEVGIFRVEVFGSGRRNRYTSSKFNVRCDAIGLHEREILLLSVIGPETSVKALTAGLRASGNDQNRIEYSASVESVE